jgi:hypothetical protein
MVLTGGQIGLGQTSGSSGETKAPVAITIAAESPIVKAGAGVSIRARLLNNSKRPLDASGCYCGPSGLDSAFVWEVRDTNGHLVAKRVYPHPELATGSLILDRIIPPGGEISGDHDVARLYDMKKPGKYVIQAGREIPKDLGGGTIKSNTVTVTIVE